MKKIFENICRTVKNDNFVFIDLATFGFFVAMVMTWVQVAIYWQDNAFWDAFLKPAIVVLVSSCILLYASVKEAKEDPKNVDEFYASVKEAKENPKNVDEGDIFFILLPLIIIIISTMFICYQGFGINLTMYGLPLVGLLLLGIVVLYVRFFYQEAKEFLHKMNLRKA